MSSITIFIHGIGSSNKAWEKFIKVQKKDNFTKHMKEYFHNETAIIENEDYYYLYGYESKKFFNFPGNEFFQEKIKGKTNPGKVPIINHSNTFLYEITELVDLFTDINIVAHSMGGVITMKMITTLIVENNQAKNKIKTCILYGSPLKGSEDPFFLESLWRKASSEILKELKPNSLTITELLKQIDTYSEILKKDFNIHFIAGDADPRIVEITKKFANKFGTFKQIKGGHSEIITPKDINSPSFISYKNIIKKQKHNIKQEENHKNDIEKFGNKILLEYMKKKSDEFSSESDSLRTLNKDVFVNIFDITNNGKKIKTENNLSYLYTLSQEKLPKFLLSNYGMGKSTITKQLFEFINNSKEYHAIFINLHLKNLKHFYREDTESDFFNKILTNKIFEEIIKYSQEISNIILEKKELFNYYFNLLEKGKLILLFDGLDEVNISSENVNDKSFLKNKELDDFINTIYSSNYSIFITCRKEYTPFYTTFNFHKNTKKTYELELLEWDVLQWNKYIEYVEKDSEKDLTKFKKDILNQKYADLPKRPLFLSMLTELIIYENKDISNITPQLETNLAEIYNKYINFCLDKDINTKIQEMQYKITDKNHYKIVWKKLLTHLAYLEYKKNKKISLNQIVSIAKNLDKDEKYYEKDIVEATLESSALFSIIHRDQSSNGFKFSHKSFLEYLVSHKLAEDIFSKKSEDALCNEAWKLYQTIEIHHHFMAEIVRVAYYQNIIKTTLENKLNYTQLFSNKHIEQAFKKTLENYNKRKKEDPNIFLTLHEDYQAIIYYIGKFKIHSLKNYLDDIITNENKYHPTFYRTVSLSLSSINEDTIFCDKYILKIINNLLAENGNLFYENQAIQKKYHGSNAKKLRKRLKKNLDLFLFSNNIINNISLIILTYYTTFTVSDEEIISFGQELKEIKKVAENKSYQDLIEICNFIPKIWLKLMEQHIDEYS